MSKNLIKIEETNKQKQIQKMNQLNNNNNNPFYKKTFLFFKIAKKIVKKFLPRTCEGKNLTAEKTFFFNLFCFFDVDGTERCLR